MELLFVYLWLKLNAILTVSLLGAILLPIVRIGFALARSDSYDKESFDSKYSKMRGRLLPTAGVLIALTVLVPNKTDVAVLVGASVALDMAKSPEGVKIGALLRGKANELLDEQLKELTKPAK